MNMTKTFNVECCENKAAKVALSKYSVVDVLLFYFIFSFFELKYILLAKHMESYINMYSVYYAMYFGLFCLLSYKSVDKSE